MTERDSDPYAEGCDAYHAGRSDTSNPYDSNTDDHLSWNDGWNSAADAATEQEEAG